MWVKGRPTGLLKKKQEFDELSKEVENFSSRLEAKVNGLTGGSSVYKFISSRNEY